MKSFLTALTTGAILAFASAEEQAAMADLPYTLGQPTFFGSGCPAGTAQVIPSSDYKTFSVLLSQYEAKTNWQTTRDRKSCNLAVNLDIKPGFTVAISQFDYRGNVFVPQENGASADFSAEYFFAGSRGPVAQYNYWPGANQNIFLSQNVAALAWSPCGQSTNFRVNTAISAGKQNTWSQDASIAIDSQDVQFGGFRFYVQWRRC